MLHKLTEGYTIREIQPMLIDPPARGVQQDKPGRHAAQSAVERLRIKLGARTLAQAVHNAHGLGIL